MQRKVLIFEDNEKLRGSLQRIFATKPEAYKVVGAFPNCLGAREKIATLRPDIILMDIEMPFCDGLQGLHISKLHFPEIKVLMITAFEDDDNVLNAIQLKADGYMLKGELPFGLFNAIDVIFSDGAHLTPSISLKIMRLMQKDQPPKKDYRLTDAEYRVLELLVKGYKYKQIAEELFVAVNTVNTHIRHIYEKLQVHSKTEAVKKAIEERLLRSSGKIT
jgi:DNA-binding NarL/FixJ family response regulator